ncbi:type II toxin-antitoxin system RelE/ParE family toxin [Agrobacterium sp. MA01]|uniref:type II toxin-antitoxin system RelE/ParE family toxin n=1 Tax=Agrobacterium sp. MA01 TaxID=2664893 RepID=UPI00129B0448|nr:type II toxin-antitoxin system RelE/ParE family toxin [Agrobacterium sp. MA01]QGG89897.1 type II toxin-antitoxin system RelE/ParE family toxin [Agrobacterium sp. MA01]
MKVVVSPSARAYVAREAGYLRERNRAAGERLLHDFKQFLTALAQSPMMGQDATELPLGGIRRFVLGDYLIHYEVGAAAIVILTIRHGRERPPELPLDDASDYEFP